MPQLGPLEIAVVLLVALLVFGPNRLPEIARQVGGALRELRKIQRNITADIHEMMADETDGAAPPPTLPPKADLAAGEVIDVEPTGATRATEATEASDGALAGVPPADVPTSGSGEDAVASPPVDEIPPPPPPPPPDPA